MHMIEAVFEWCIRTAKDRQCRGSGIAISTTSCIGGTRHFVKTDWIRLAAVLLVHTPFILLRT